MKNKNLILYILLSTIVFSCSERKEIVVRVKVQKMTAFELYNKELAYDVIFDSEEMNMDSLKNKSGQAFLKGVEAFKNKKNTKQAIEFFKSSILIFPQSKTYYELGNALMDLKQEPYLTEAIQAYEVAEYLNFHPLSKIYYKSAIAHFMLSNSRNLRDDERQSYYYQSLSMLRNAFYNGFSDTSMISSDSRISKIVNTADYRSLLTNITAEKLKENNNSLFGLYIKSFPQRSLPFEIPVDKVGMADYTESISYDFAEFIPEMENTTFGREVSHDYFYVAKIADEQAYKAVVYSSISFFGEKMQPVTTNLVTYNKEGKIISRKMLACQCSAEKIKTGKIEKGLITIEDYKRIWESPIDEVPFEKNSVKEYLPMAKAQFKIDDTGKIVDYSTPVIYSDSLKFAKRN